MRVNAVIVAAGEGKRMGGHLPKPFLSLAGRPLILHTLGRFASSRARKVILVAAEKEMSRCRDLISSDSELHGIELLLQPGGARRQDSVHLGLGRLDPDCEIVVIHDGARPFVSARLIDLSVEAASREGAAVVGVPARDTVKLVTGDRFVGETPPRDLLWEIQTPQAFRTEIIREAYDRARRESVEATDDAALVERLGTKVKVLEGERTNIKITLPLDLLLAEALIREGRVP